MSASGRCEYCSGRAEPKGQRCELCKARQVRKSVEHVADREDAALEKMPSMDDVAKSLMGVPTWPGVLDEAAAFGEAEYEALRRVLRVLRR